MTVFRHTGQVRFHETDASGRFHYTNAMIWAENAEHALYRHIGACSNIQSLPRRAVSATYHRSFFAGDPYTVELSIDRLGNTSLTYSWRVFDGDMLSAEGSTTIVHVDAEGKSSPLPKPLRAGLMAYLDGTG